jgi:hypothetical protein
MNSGKTATGYGGGFGEAEPGLAGAGDALALRANDTVPANRVLGGQGNVHGRQDGAGVTPGLLAGGESLAQGSPCVSPPSRWRGPDGAAATED